MTQKANPYSPITACIRRKPTVVFPVAVITAAFALLLFSAIFFISPVSAPGSEYERQEHLLSDKFSEHKGTHTYIADNTGHEAFFKSNFNLNGLTQKARNDYYIDFYDGDTRVASIFAVGYRGDKSDEAKQVSFILGKAYCDGVAKDVYLNLYYIDENGQCMHWNAPDGELAICRLFNTTSEEFASSFSLVRNPSGSAWRHCTPKLIGEDHSSNSMTNSNTEKTQEFWGVWIGASKDKAIANSIADKAKEEGFDDVQVIITSDWENLNPETWYAVAVGCFDSKEKAEAILEEARDINQDAYIKHSGSHK